MWTEDAKTKLAMTATGLAGATHTSTTVVDSTGKFVFDLASLPSVPTYNAAGQIVTMTYGPDVNGRSIRQTTTWVNGQWMGDSAWVLVS